MYKMYDGVSDGGSDDKSSLSSAFWTEDEKQEEDEEVEIHTGDAGREAKVDEALGNATGKENPENHTENVGPEGGSGLDSNIAARGYKTEENIGKEYFTPVAMTNELQENLSGSSLTDGSVEEEDVDSVSEEEESCHTSEEDGGDGEEESEEGDDEDDSKTVAEAEDSFSEDSVEPESSEEGEDGDDEEDSERDVKNTNSKYEAGTEDSFWVDSEEDQSSEGEKCDTGEEEGGSEDAGSEEGQNGDDEDEESDVVVNKKDSTSPPQSEDFLKDDLDGDEGLEEREHFRNEESGQKVRCSEDVFQKDLSKDEEEDGEWWDKTVAEAEDQKTSGDVSDDNEKEEDYQAISEDVSKPGVATGGSHTEEEDTEDVVKENVHGNESRIVKQKFVLEAPADAELNLQIFVERSENVAHVGWEVERRCSPAPSLMTSGYGTYRPDEQEAEDHRDDQDSRGDLSETRDEGDEDALSFSSFNWFDIELASAPEFHRTGEDGDEENPDCLRTYCVHDSPRDDEAEMSNIRPHNHKDQADDKKSGLHRDGSIGFESDVEHHRGSTGGTACEKEDKNMLDLRGDDRVEDRAEDRYDPEDSSGSGSNKDIRFLDSEVDSDWMTSSGVLEEKLRPKGKCLQVYPQTSSCCHISIRGFDCGRGPAHAGGKMHSNQCRNCMMFTAGT